MTPIRAGRARAAPKGRAAGAPPAPDPPPPPPVADGLSGLAHALAQVGGAAGHHERSRGVEEDDVPPRPPRPREHLTGDRGVSPGGAAPPRLAGRRLEGR